MRTDCRRLFFLSSLSLLPLLAAPQQGDSLLRPALAQEGAGRGLTPAERVGQETRDRIIAGRTLYDNNDVRAVATLRDASQNALTALGQVAGMNVLTEGNKSFPNDVITAALAQRAAEAHFYWGLAADRFARRDEAITALTRSLRISRAIAISTTDNGNLRRDAALELGRILRDGLPLIAPDDTLDSIASISHGRLWTPRRVSFEPGPIATDVAGASNTKFEFLVTDGKLFPPVSSNNALARIPPYYQGVPAESLPAVLQLDKMVAGYARETTGSNKGQWRQMVRVFYASPYLTKGRRDDLPRARALCEQFLKVQALVKDKLGATNLYARGDRIAGVSTLWLLEVSALWPQDDEDPAILAQLGPLMPKLNTGSRRDIIDPEVTATVRPWMPIAGQAEAAPGEIMFWKASMVRPEAEWVRELFHEYGHVSLPPLGGFRPPLEPFANGMMGETLGMLWAAQSPERFGAAGKEFAFHASTQALPALRFFLKAGPGSSLRASGTTDGWHYLQGLTTYLERVYGGRLLGRAMTPLANRASNVSNLAARRSLMSTQTLMNSLDQSWRNPWGKTNTLPIWLPGALDNSPSATTLISRGEGMLKSGSTTPALLYVPIGTESLRVDGSGTSKLRVVGLPFKAADGGVRIYFAGKSGWQKFSLAAGTDTKISGARFEKK
jgi:hypothetical protein